MRQEKFNSRTEIVGVEWTRDNEGPLKKTKTTNNPHLAKQVGYGNVVGRADADDNTRLVGVRFRGQHPPVYVPDTATFPVTYTASLSVEHFDMETVEDSALALMQWLYSDNEFVVEVACKETGDTYLVRIDVGEDGSLTATRAGAERK